LANKAFDAIVVGARCAGSPVAMLLARRGYKVLVVDKATFPSDTISTHLIHTPGVAALKRWGLFDDLRAMGCPPIDTYATDFGPFTITGSPAIDGASAAYAPRRTKLDKLLVDAASEAGAEVREGFTVEELATNDGRVTGIRGHSKNGRTIMEHARVVIGADGRHSLVSAAMRPEQYHVRPKLQVSYYSYFSNLPMDNRFETYVRFPRAFAAWPTNDGLTLIIAGWQMAEFETNRTDIEGNFLKTIEMAPSFAARFHAARCEERFLGAAVPNYFRKPYGPGWALVGDAGYNKDFITAQGMQDAFLDAELCATALDEAFSGARSFERAMSGYQSARDERALPVYELTCQLASLEPPPPEMQQIFAAMHGNQQAMDGFARVLAGATSPAEFFAPENVGRMLDVAA
jgi:2-polyprenyl-6-methoxyphenol hydroxylase-like FAD-dependent oxidoreductase